MKLVSMEALKYFYSKLEQVFSGVTVTIEPQTFTEEQKAQARANIGVDSSDVSVDGTSIVKSDENVISLATDLQNKINNSVQNPQTGTVGQVLAVKTVDASGKPTAWEAVSQPSSAGGVKRYVLNLSTNASTIIDLSDYDHFPTYIVASGTGTGINSSTLGPIIYLSFSSGGYLSIGIPAGTSPYYSSKKIGTWEYDEVTKQVTITNTASLKLSCTLLV